MAGNDVMIDGSQQVLPKFGVTCHDCLTCVNGFATLKELERHRELHDVKLCVVCDERLPSQTELLYHIRKHRLVDGPSTWKKYRHCVECVYGFKKAWALEEHLCWFEPALTIYRNQGYDGGGGSGCEITKTYVCCYCHLATRYKQNLRGHMKTHSMSPRFSCFVCDHECGTLSLVLYHMKAHELELPAGHGSRAKICSKPKVIVPVEAKPTPRDVQKARIVLKGNASQQRPRDKQRGKIDLKGKGSPVKRKHEQQLERKGNQGTYVKVRGYEDMIDARYLCSSCTRSFKHANTRNRHERDDHGIFRQKISRGTDFSKVSAEGKGKDVQGTQPFEAIIDQTGARWFLCPHCPKMFRFLCKVKKHLLNHPIENSHFKCDFCPKIFRAELSKRMHERFHAAAMNRSTSMVKPAREKGEKTSGGSAPGGTAKRLVNVAHVNKRRKKMWNDRVTRLSKTQAVGIVRVSKAAAVVRYACTYCPKRLRTKAALISHLKSHDKHCPIYPCRFCPLKLALKSQRETHEDTHFGGVDFPCLKCSESYESKAALIEHIKVHDSERESFTACMETSATHPAIRKHLEQHVYVTETEKAKSELESPEQQTGSHGLDCGKAGNPELTLTGTRRRDKKPDKERPETLKEGQCPVCFKHYVDSQNLKRHMKIHDENRDLFPCRFCSKKMTENWTRNRHEEMHKRKKFMCAVCERPFATRVQMMLHARMHGTKCIFPCPECEEEFDSKPAVKEHIESKHGFASVCTSVKEETKPQYSSVKTELLVSEENISSVSSIRTVPIGRDEPMETCPVSSTTDIPEEKPADDLRLKCHLCEMRFYSRLLLKKHVQSHRAEEQDVSAVTSTHDVCPIPKTESSSPYKIHFLQEPSSSLHDAPASSYEAPLSPDEEVLSSPDEAMPSPDEAMPSPDEEYQSSEETDSIQHEVHPPSQHLKTSPEKPRRRGKKARGIPVLTMLPAECRICHKFIHDYKDILRHFNEHYEGWKAIDSRLFRCLVCDHQCNKKGNMKDHMPLHTGEKKFRCSICMFGCSRRRRMELHILSHEKDPTCPTCQSKFRTLEELKTHVVTSHPAPNPSLEILQCELCPETFETADALRKHIDSHDEEELYQCHSCDNVYTSVRKLEAHIQTEHG